MVLISLNTGRGQGELGWCSAAASASPKTGFSGVANLKKSAPGYFVWIPPILRHGSPPRALCRAARQLALTPNRWVCHRGRQFVDRQPSQNQYLRLGPVPRVPQTLLGPLLTSRNLPTPGSLRVRVGFPLSRRWTLQGGVGGLGGGGGLLREPIAEATPNTRLSKTPAKRADQVTKTTSTMNNTSSQQTTPQQSNRPATRHAATSYVDLSRGATEFGISGQTVRLDADVIEGYAEVDSALGRNVGGVACPCSRGTWPHSRAASREILSQRVCFAARTPSRSKSICDSPGRAIRAPHGWCSRKSGSAKPVSNPLAEHDQCIEKPF